MEQAKELINEKTLQERIVQIANQIMEDYGDKELTFICILKGSVYFTADLSKKIKNNVKLEFIKVSSYGASMQSSGKIELNLDLNEDIEGKDVIVIEDIVDTGRTLKYLKEHLESKKPKSVKICALLDKKERRVCEINADYVGFDIPDKFIVGYGLDYNQDYRNLPYIGYLGN